MQAMVRVSFVQRKINKLFNRTDKNSNLKKKIKQNETNKIFNLFQITWTDPGMPFLIKKKLKKSDVDFCEKYTSEKYSIRM